MYGKQLTGDILKSITRFSSVPGQLQQVTILHAEISPRCNTIVKNMDACRFCGASANKYKSGCLLQVQVPAEKLRLIKKKQ